MEFTLDVGVNEFDSGAFAQAIAAACEVPVELVELAVSSGSTIAKVSIRAVPTSISATSAAEATRISNVFLSMFAQGVAHISQQLGVVDFVS